MGYPPEHREQTRRRILTAAGRLFRRHGYDAASIDEIMATAGLTRGGFYLHFRSKADLFAQVLADEWEFTDQLRAGRESSPEKPLAGAWQAIEYYLTPENRGKIGRGCTIVANAHDVARGSRAAKRAFTESLRPLAEEFGELVPRDSTDRDARALAALATCIGGVVVARALADDQLISDLLAACRKSVARDLGAEDSAAVEPEAATAT